MKKAIKALSIASFAGIWAASITGCMEGTVSFEKDVRPILAKNCLECHQQGSEGFKASRLALGTFDDLMKGTKPKGGAQRGQVVIPGDPVSSTLMALVEGRADPSIAMPHGKEPLNKKDIAVIGKWIEQGAKKN